MFGGRRLFVLVALVFGLTALAATLTAPREPAAPPAVAQPSRPLDLSGGPEPGVRVRPLSVDDPATTIRARVGQTLRLEISGDATDAVLIDGLDRVEAIDPQSPARIEILAERPGSYDIRLLEGKRSVGTLEILP